MIRPLHWTGDRLVVLDQTALPRREVTRDLRSCDEVAEAIRTLVVRGAPAIGVAAAFGLALAARRSPATTFDDFIADLQRASHDLAATRPTAVSLFWALRRMEGVARDVRHLPLDRIRARLVVEARTILGDDLAANRALSDLGVAVVPPDARILTHCNTGALATTGHGTALGVVRSAHAHGKLRLLWIDETRPVMQGSRLTAWECVRDHIPHRILVDAAAGWLMARREVDLVITGADRIARNGDTANKVGTYSLAVLARHHAVPFYIAAPFSTIDAGLAHGGDIALEERDASEVRRVGAEPTAPAESPVFNQAFDVTPACLITGIITERGVYSAPYDFA